MKVTRLNKKSFGVEIQMFRGKSIISDQIPCKHSKESN